MVSRRVDSYGLALPNEWQRIPLDRAKFEQFARQQRSRLAGRGDLSRTGQRQFEVVLRQLRNDCVRRGVVLVSVFAAAIDAEARETGLLAATCTLATLDQAGLATALPLTVNTLLAATARSRRAIDVAPPDAVDLAGGRAVRLVRLHRVGGEDGARVLAEHYLLPHGDGQRAAVLSLATPNVEFCDPMRALFGEVANTLRTFAGDEPTDVTGDATRVGVT